MDGAARLQRTGDQKWNKFAIIHIVVINQNQDGHCENVEEKKGNLDCSQSDVEVLLIVGRILNFAAKTLLQSVNLSP